MTHRFALYCRAKGHPLTFRHSQCHSIKGRAERTGRKDDIDGTRDANPEFPWLPSEWNRLTGYVAP